jgi:hypothetical protein
MNSRNKGKRGEKEFAALLREHGFDARRGQQFSGSPDSPDVVCEALAWLHIEVKRTQALNLTDACAQAEGDSKGKPWIVAHRRNRAPWLITMRAETFFDLIREFQPQRHGDAEGTDGCGVKRISAEGAVESRRSAASSRPPNDNRDGRRAEPRRGSRDRQRKDETHEDQRQ